MRKDASVGIDLYGRDVSASKALKTVGGHADNLATKVTHIGDKMVKAMGVAVVAAGALAVKIGVDSVKAAIEDQKSSAMLKQAIEANTKATDAQIASVDKYITKQQLRFGVDDDLLKNGLAKLVRATGDVTKAQKLLNVAVDISAGTGKSLETVTLALAKAHGGNLGALTRLGIKIDASIIKNKDFAGALGLVEKAYGGAGAAAANTFRGRLDRANQAIQVAKEKLGYLLLPYVERFAKYVAEKLVPALDTWIDKNGPKLQRAIEKVIPKVQQLVDTLIKITDWAIDHKEGLATFAKVLAGIYGTLKLYAGFKAIVGGIMAISTALGALAASETAVAAGGVAISKNPIALALTGLFLAGSGTAFALWAETFQKMPAGKNAGGVKRTLPGTVNWAKDKREAQNITINVHGSVVTEQDLVRKVRTAFTAANRRQGADVNVAGQGKTKR